MDVYIYLLGGVLMGLLVMSTHAAGPGVGAAATRRTPDAALKWVKGSWCCLARGEQNKTTKHKHGVIGGRFTLKYVNDNLI